MKVVLPLTLPGERQPSVSCGVRRASKLRSQPPDPSSTILLSVLGPFALVVGGKPIALSSRKSQALLLLLSRRRGGQAPREVVIGLLWGDSPDQQARASLRQALLVLRRELGEAGRAILSEGDTLLLAEGSVSTDLAEFELLAARHDIESLAAAVALYRGDFAEGFPAIAPEFDQWVEAERAYLQAQVSALLLRLCDAQAASGDIEGSIATAHRLIGHDPLQEHVHRRLIQAYLRLKRYDAALKQFDTLKTTLDQELGVAPEQPTLDLIRQVRQARSGRPDRAEADRLASPRDKRPSIPGRPSIAVLTFRSLSPAPETALFGEGISDEIIIELGREAGLMVVSRASSSRFDANAEDVQGIGEALGVRFVLTGSVRSAGDRVRVTAHLTETGNGREVWAERYDRDLSDIFAIQTDIARTVSATVVGRINETEARAADTRSLNDLDAIALLLQGERHMNEYSEAGFTAAVEHFRRAAALAPTLARAHGYLALGVIILRWNFHIDVSVDDALPIAERAVALDWRDAKGHCALGVAYLLKRDFGRAEYHFETGLQLNPNDERLLIEHGRFLMYAARPEEGLMRVREAMRLNPFHPNWYWNIVGRCLHTLGRYAEALEAFQRVQAPPFSVYAYIAACHRMLGHEEAVDEAQATMRASRPDLDATQFRRMFPYKDEAAGRLFFESMFD